MTSLCQGSACGRWTVQPSTAPPTQEQVLGTPHHSGLCGPALAPAPWPALGTHCGQLLALPWTPRVTKASCPFLTGLPGQPSPRWVRSPAEFGASKAKVRTNCSIYKQGEGTELEYTSLTPEAPHMSSSPAPMPAPQRGKLSWPG